MTPDDYVVGHVGDALATDPRAGVLDVRVAIADGRVVLTGTVETSERAEAIVEVAAEAADGLEVVSQLTILDCPPPTASEEL